MQDAYARTSLVLCRVLAPLCPSRVSNSLVISSHWLLSREGAAHNKLSVGKERTLSPGYDGVLSEAIRKQSCMCISVKKFVSYTALPDSSFPRQHGTTGWQCPPAGSLALDPCSAPTPELYSETLCNRSCYTIEGYWVYQSQAKTFGRCARNGSSAHNTSIMP